MKKLKLSTQLNISFGIVLYIPMVVATIYSIIFFSSKIQAEAVRKVNSDMKTAEFIYQGTLKEMKNILQTFSQKKTLKMLLKLDLGVKLGEDLAQDAKEFHLDMITVFDTTYKVLVRSHAPTKINDMYPQQNLFEQVFKGSVFAGAEILTAKDLEFEGFQIKNQLMPKYIFSISAVAPVYDRDQNISGAILIRRFISSESEMIRHMHDTLKLSVALFAHTTPVATLFNSSESAQIINSTSLLQKALDEDQLQLSAEFRKGGHISIFLPLHGVEKKPVGILMVNADVNDYLETRNSAIVILLSILLIGTLLSYSIKTIIMKRILTPVQRLKEGTERIGTGGSNYQIKITSDDEIGELTNAFNQMTQDLYVYQNKLKENNALLEVRVEMRTRELKETNEELLKTNQVLEDTLERLNPGVSKLIGNNKQQLGLVYATELVADVCNYTKLNMLLGETIVGEFMKKFFRESHKLFARYHGMFDKTVGDQVIGIFGIIKDDFPANETHPIDAIDCAMELVEKAKRLNQQLQEVIEDNYTAIVSRRNSLSEEDRGMVKIEDIRFNVRVGINTSNPVSGREIDRMRMVMMGAETCMDYTAQGGAVIYAFRLESSGIPGEIHIGENTKRQVEHMFKLEEKPPINLKGLGIQPVYRVVGRQSIFESIYPKTTIYLQYRNHVPDLLINILNNLYVGRMQIYEVRKINEFIDVNLRYLEYLAGYFNLFFARALFTYGIAEKSGLPFEQLQAMLLASIWYNMDGLIKEIEWKSLIELKSIDDQLPEGIDMNFFTNLKNDLMKPKSETPEAMIIQMCNDYDSMVFDRTLLQKRAKDILPSKQVISFMKLENKYSDELIRILEELMIVENTMQIIPSDENVSNYLILPQNIDLLTTIIKTNLTEEQRQYLKEHI
ncbi:MAG: HAMP domain-containing protein [Desulfobacterales bacterium]|nr:HAMP domain-containing protein [Desulfobacterales bacterium]